MGLMRVLLQEDAMRADLKCLAANRIYNLIGFLERAVPQKTGLFNVTFASRCRTRVSLVARVTAPHGRRAGDLSPRRAFDTASSIIAAANAGGAREV